MWASALAGPGAAPRLPAPPSRAASPSTTGATWPGDRLVRVAAYSAPRGDGNDGKPLGPRIASLPGPTAANTTAQAQATKAGAPPRPLSPDDLASLKQGEQGPVEPFDGSVLITSSLVGILTGACAPPPGPSEAPPAGDPSLRGIEAAQARRGRPAHVALRSSPIVLSIRDWRTGMRGAASLRRGGLLRPVGWDPWGAPRISPGPRLLRVAIRPSPGPTRRRLSLLAGLSVIVFNESVHELQHQVFR